MSFFDHLNNITVNKKEYENNDEFNKEYFPFMINRFISMVDLYLPAVNEINQYDVPKDVHYNYYLSFLPKRKHYFKYIKKEKELNKDEIEYLMKYFECGKKEINQYLNVLSSEQINKIIKVYKYGVK